MACSFYGRALWPAPGAQLIATGGNRCALITEAHSPCIREINGGEPDWEGCIRNPEENGTGRAALEQVLYARETRKP